MRLTKVFYLAIIEKFIKLKINYKIENLDINKINKKKKKKTMGEYNQLTLFMERKKIIFQNES